MNALALVLVALALLVLASSATLKARARRQRNALKLGGGELVYLDESVKSEVLTSQAWGLKGKPDLLLKRGGFIIPVDQKPGRSRQPPFPSHTFQLAAYCALVEDVYGVRPTHGVIRYEDRDVEVPYTPQLEAKLRQTLQSMREARTAADVARNHDSVAKCRGCGFRNGCAQSLAHRHT